MLTGWVGNDGSGVGPVINNAEAGYDWTTYPERLERAGVSWKVYQDVGTGLNAAGSWGWTQDPYIGNYGDNSLLHFHRYQNAKPGTPASGPASPVGSPFPWRTSTDSRSRSIRIVADSGRVR